MSSTKKRRLPILLAVIAIAALIASTVGGARAALTIKSDEYETQFEMYHIGITLNENGKPLAWRNYRDEAWYVDTPTYKNGRATLLGNMQTMDGEPAEDFAYGTMYKEELSVTNSGAIDEYVRVTVRKYWQDESGEEMTKNTDLDPSMIDLHLTEGSGWIEDTTLNDPERTVLYYTKPLKIGEVSPLFADTLTVSGDVKKHVTQTTETKDDGTVVVKNTYTYDGVTFCIDVEADGVQTHNAEDAISSAWGRAVDIDESGTLSFK